MTECRTRDISEYTEWCDTHNQDASLCHLLTNSDNVKPKRKEIQLMKKLIATAISLSLLVAPAAVGAKSTKLAPQYQAEWCYPTGTYWQAQQAKYPDYYANPANDAKYRAKYGPGTKYCPN